MKFKLTIELSQEFLGETFTLKWAVKEFMKATIAEVANQNKIKGKYYPNQHIHIAHIRNCKSILKKL